MQTSQPVMHVIAGPPGSGKSTAFPVAEVGIDYFDADLRASQFHGSFQGISRQIRELVNRELESFIESHVQDRKSMAFETTLRTAITFDQAKRARLNGFLLSMTFVGLPSVKLHVERVAIRVDAGGHATDINPKTAVDRPWKEQLP